ITSNILLAFLQLFLLPIPPTTTISTLSLHDALPILGRRAARADRGAGAREELRRHGRVPRGAGGGRGGAVAGRVPGARLRGAVQGAPRRDAARAPVAGVRARDAAGHDVRLGPASRGRAVGRVSATRARGRRG